MPAVRFQKVSKKYGDSYALSEIDLDVQRGEFLTLLGPSGSGKTTLLNIIAGLTKPTSGKIFIDGRDATSLPPGERSLGMVFQNYALMPHMTVFENIAFPLRVRNLPEAEIAKRVREALELIRLPEVAKRKPRELSGGQQQRVSLARAVVYKPSIVLMDEPLGALDRKLREQMQLEIKRIHHELEITMLNVTHDQEEALTLSDRIVLMNKGRIEQAGTPIDLYFRPQSHFAADFIGEANFLRGRTAGKTAGGVLVDTEAGRINCATARPADGETLVMVRPENVLVAEGATDASADGMNQLAATVVDHLILGGILKHRLVLPSGKQVTAQQSNHVGVRIFSTGDRVRLLFKPDSAVMLPQA